MNQREISSKLETLKSAVGNEECTMSDVLEFLEDLLCDIQGDGCYDYNDVSDDYTSYDINEPDYTKLQVID